MDKVPRHLGQRWSARLLYVVVAVCFAPLLSMLALGVIAMPMWISMLVMKIIQPKRFDPGDSIWHIVFPIVSVVGGVIGTIGLFRALALLGKDANVRSRKVTSAMVAVGLAVLSVFNLITFEPFSTNDDEGSDWISLAVYVVLPYFASICVLYAARKSLWSAWQVPTSGVRSA
jgi:hypothetical protein